MDQQKKTARKAYKVRVSANALRNIDEITGYIAFFNHQPLNAVRVGDEIFKVIDKIAVNPLAFSSRKPSKLRVLKKVK